MLPVNQASCQKEDVYFEEKDKSQMVYHLAECCGRAHSKEESLSIHLPISSS